MTDQQREFEKWYQNPNPAKYSFHSIKDFYNHIWNEAYAKGRQSVLDDDVSKESLLLAIGEFSAVCMKDNPKWVFPSEEAIRIANKYSRSVDWQRLKLDFDEEFTSNENNLHPIEWILSKLSDDKGG